MTVPEDCLQGGVSTNVEFCFEFNHPRKSQEVSELVGDLVAVFKDGEREKKKEGEGKYKILCLSTDKRWTGKYSTSSRCVM